MGRPVSADLQALLDLPNANTQTTLALYLADTTEMFFSTDEFTLSGKVYAANLRQSDELKQSIFSATDRISVTIQNIDKLFGGTVTDEDLVKGEGVLGRYYRDPAGVLTPVSVELFRGEIRPTNLDESEAKLEILHDLAACGYCVGEDTLAENCQWVYKHAGTCGSTSILATCNKKRRSKAGCWGRDNEEHFGGMEFPDVQKPAAPVGGGDPGGGGHNNCPRIDQRIPVANNTGAIGTKSAGTIEQGDRIYNPKTERFHKVRSAEIVKDQAIWCVASSAGVQGFSSMTHPVLPYREHETGVRVTDIAEGNPLLLWSRTSLDVFNHAASASFDTGETGDVVRIELEDGHVYAYGDSDDTFIVCHNAKPIE